MKFFKSLTAVMAMLAVMFVTSCSSSEETVADKLGAYISDDADLIVSGDLSRFIAATGSKVNEETQQIEPSSELESLIQETMSKHDRAELDKVLNFEGADWSNAVMAFKFKDQLKSVDAMLIFSVTDADKFAKNLSDEVSSLDVAEEDDYVTVSNDKVAIMLKDKIGFVCLKNSKPCKASSAAEMIESWKEAADEKPLAEWKSKHITSDHVVNFYLNSKKIAQNIDDDPYLKRQIKENPAFTPIYNSWKSGATLGYLDIEKQSVSVQLSFVDKDGKEIKTPLNGTIDTSLLKYGNSNDIAACGMANTKDLVEAMRQYAAKEGLTSDAEFNMLFNGLFGKLDGSILLMGGPKTSNLNDLDEWEGYNFVAAATYRDGGAAEALANVSQLMEMAIQGGTNDFAIVTSTPNELVFDFVTGYEYPDYDYYADPVRKTMRIYVKVYGNDLVMSNDPIQATGAAIGAADLKGASGAMGFVLNKNGKLLSNLNLNFGVKGYLKTNGATTTLELSLVDTNLDIVGAIMSVLGGRL